MTTNKQFSSENGETVFPYFILLIAIFLLGFMGAIALDHIFDHLLQKLQQKATNEQARIAIGHEILKDLKEVQIQFFAMPISNTLKGQEIAHRQLLENLDKIGKELDILENGGTLELTWLLNLSSRDEMQTEITFQANSDHELILEIMDLRPKLHLVAQKAEELENLLAKRSAAHRLGNQQGIVSTVKATKMFLKTVPAIFLRMTEHANAIFYRSLQHLKLIEKELTIRKHQYNVIEGVLIVTIILIILGLSAHIGQKVHRIIVRQQTAEKAVRASEKQMRQQNQFLTTIIDALTHPFYVISVKDYHIIMANKAARKLSPTTCRTCYELTHHRDTPCSDDEHICPLNEVLRTGEAVQIEQIHYDAENNIRNVEVFAYPVTDETGEIIQMIEYSIDVTEQREIELQVRKLSRAVEQSAASVVITDTEGCIEYVNPKFVEITGYTQEEAIGENPRILKANLTPDTVYEDLWKTISKGAEWRGELHNKKKNGDLYWEEAYISPIFDDNGQIMNYLGIKQDITERKRKQTELSEAKEAAEAATLIKSEFLANMSHEIRTPMNGIIGMTSLLLDSPLDPEQYHQMLIIRNSGNTLLTIINDILDFSKIEAGQLELENLPFNLRTCIEGAVDLLAQTAQDKSLELTYLINENCPNNIVGDVTRLRQILVNLLSNAIKFTPEGEISLCVRNAGAENIPGEDEHINLHFSVRDTGIGIPLDRVKILFQSFTQVDASTTRKFGGTGLGLAISRELTEKMGGSMWVDSQIDKGSTFHFSILVKAATMPPEEAVKSDKRIGKVISTDIAKNHPRHILLAEDNLVNQKVASSILGKMGYRVDVVSNGCEAVDALMLREYDVVFMDIQMPEMDGTEATRLIREKIHKDKQPRIIAMTANAMAGDREKYLDLGMDDYISKPINPNDLVQVLLRS